MSNQRAKSKHLLGFQAAPREASVFRGAAKSRLTTIAGLFRQLATGSLFHPMHELMSAQDTREFFGNAIFKELLDSGRLQPSHGEGDRGLFDTKAVATLSETLEIEQWLSETAEREGDSKGEGELRKSRATLKQMSQKGVVAGAEGLSAADILGWLSSGFAPPVIYRQVWNWRAAGRPRQISSPRVQALFPPEKLGPHGLLEMLEAASQNQHLQAQLLENQAQQEKRRGKPKVAAELITRAKAKSDRAASVDTKLKELRAKSATGERPEILDEENFSRYYE